ncbi:MAG: patatin-like phospholipase family protein [Alphaproteobacteria bacterium]|nr:patatin-like phospholipase family protein [Alphaproteobacteria bacterium]
MAAALRRRRDSGASGPPFDDGLRIALVAEGGAMRGVIAGGMVSAIEAAGLGHCFDLMIGTSAGACALAYLRAGQARFGTRIFYEDINNRAFIDPLRALRGRPVVDIDFLVDRVFAAVKPLDRQRLAEPGPELVATATDVRAAETVYLTGFGAPGRALEILRATTQMPLLAAGPVALDGRRLLDGGVLNHLPLMEALARGATHALVILTRSPDAPALRRPPWAERRLLPRRLHRLYGPQLAERARAEAEHYRALYRALPPLRAICLNGAHVLAVGPAASEPAVGRTEKSALRLRAAAAHAEARMRQALEAP